MAPAVIDGFEGIICCDNNHNINDQTIALLTAFFSFICINKPEDKWKKRHKATNHPRHPAVLLLDAIHETRT
jgi:hypothetical protein